MLTDRTTRVFFAVSLFTVALILGLNLLIDREGMPSWATLAAAVALAGSIGLAITVWLEDRDAKQSESAQATSSQNVLGLPQAQEWIISKDLLPTPTATHSASLPSVAADGAAERDSSETIITEPPAAKTRSQDGITDRPADEIIEAEAAGEEAPIVTEAKEKEPIAEARVAEASAAQVAPALNEKEAKAAVDQAVDADDLKIIEGIGPAYSEALRNAGILTFKQLAASNRETLENAIRAAGYTRIPSSINTWPEQAALLAAGDQAGFERLVNSISAGRRKSEG